jgi:Ca2+-binding EF-hand superfamily protein
MFSQNGSLDVNSERLLAWFHSIGISGDDNGEIEALFSAFDDDGNGVLDQDELLEMMMFLIRGHRQITGSGSVECLISRYLFLFIVLTCFT